MTTAKKQPIRVNLLDLTLKQLDQVERLAREIDSRDKEPYGTLAAAAFIALRGTEPRFSTLRKCADLTSRDVEIVEEEDDDDTPTSAQS